MSKVWEVQDYQEDYDKDQVKKIQMWFITQMEGLDALIKDL